MLPIDHLYRSAARAPDALAVDAPGERLDYAALAARVDALAAGLQALDPEPQSRVGICAPNTLEHLLALLAVMAAGKVWVPLNPLDGPPLLAAKMERAAPSLLVVAPECLERLPEDGTPRLLAGAAAGWDGETLAGLAARHAGRRPARPPLGPEDAQALKFTGGSSGVPKGVLQPYRAWLAGARCMADAFSFAAADRFLLAAPLTHATSCYVTPMLAAGGTLVLLAGRPRPEAVLAALAGREVSATFLPPTLIYMLLAALDGRRAEAPRLRLLVYGGAPMPAERIRAAQRAFGPVVGCNYGLTEAPQVITSLRPEEALDERRVASVGRPGPGTEVAVVDAEGRRLGPGERGEVVVRGELLMSGYLGMPEASAAALRDGWLHTGDLGYLDGDGYLFLKDRIKDVIISGGFNVYPSDVEAVLATHPGVHECVVFGLPDEKWGEAVHAAVEPRPGASLSEGELIAFAKRQLGSVQAPKRIHVLAELPRSGVGKVQRREVRERFAAGG